MAYQIDRYNNTILTVVEDGTVDQTTDLRFVGKNYAGYGEIQNENFLYLLENFSGANPPPRAVSGQVWFDSASSKLKFYDGSIWRTTGGSEIAASSPSGLSSGDFWWDTENEQLYVWNGSTFILIGPQNAGDGITQMISLDVADTASVPKGIIASTVEDEIVAILSPTEFTLSNNTPIEGFDRIKKGITLKWTRLSDNGITNSNSVAGREYWFWGTASNADKLGGRSATEYLLANNVSFNQTVTFGDEGIKIGNSQDLLIYIDTADGETAIIENDTGQNSSIKVVNRDGNGTRTHSVTFNSEGMIPPITGTFNLGSNTNKWASIYSNNFTGLASEASQVRVNGVSRSASTSASANTIAARDADANITANLFQGTATQARYADLAEKYTTKEDYTVGTVLAVCMCEGHELEVASASSVVVGVISEKPAYLMNAEAEGQAVALKGRVPVRITGPVKKGQAVYAWQDGVASTLATTGLVGVALETNHDEGEKLVECVLKV